MARLIKKITTNQRGFTLVELVVVIAIMGVLAAVATPLLVNFLSGAKAQAYNADVEVIQTAVDAWYTDPANSRFLGKNQYPLLGRGEFNRGNHTVRAKVAQAGAVVGSFAHPDDGTPLVASQRDATAGNDNPDWNPLGGTQGADLLKATAVAPATGQIIAWTDDGDSVREIIVATSETTRSPDTWTTIEVTRESVVYYVDARYYFIDIGALVSGGFLKETPKSSSTDNSATGTGSYTYYVDTLGRVRTLLSSFPRTAGFADGVYP
jgi:prepilin-type N-terminal cleavage/methylation domain-containing protein